MFFIRVFRTVATTALKDAGRGTIVVDTTLEPVPGAGNPFAYFSQEQVEERGNEDTQRMVAKYDPTQEFVVVLLKSGDCVSTYRVGTVLLYHIDLAGASGVQPCPPVRV